ncbi:DUF2780 domain-containing protein [Vibrio sp. VB16]|uniref:DUF2780 domain-containing protein n=1 Tax=Vibrio sp. VB16 TaxID=2785746 RepID=UPI001E4E2586|nr:DUF2780 domain-containing protein [Vibrio sp. VB16]UGA55078.1 DUF2780 domain-containing protein [Vibrio sp. VB16]
MKKITLLAALTTLIVSMPSHALFGLGSDSDTKLDTDAIKSMAGSLSTEASKQESSPLLDALTSQLNVSPEQASGGAGALLALASSSLSGSESSELSNLIPGMSSLSSAAPGLLNMAGDMGAVTDIFTKLGLDPSMVSQFAPVILEYLTGQGASSGLLSSLGSLWK